MSFELKRQRVNNARITLGVIDSARRSSAREGDERNDAYNVNANPRRITL